jgi:hypothetical protein
MQCFDQDAGQAGRQGKTCEALGDIAARSKLIQKQLRALDSLRRRSIQPVESVGMGDSHRAQAEEKLGEIGARNLGSVVLGPQRIIFRRVETDHLSRTGAGGSAGSLDRRSLTDTADLQGG